MEVKLLLKELKSNIKLIFMSNKLYNIYNSGIYTITNKIDGKMLVGYASNFTKRKNWHFTKLENKNHPNSYLQNAVNKHGIENFEFDILEEYPNEGFILPSMEHYWANLLDTHNRERGYNLQPTNPYDKISHSVETRKKMSDSNKGRKWTQEQRDKYSKSRKGKKSNLSEEGRKIVAKAQEKSVIQYDLEMNPIQEWGSLKEASETLNINLASISGACHNRMKTYKGFIWRLKNTTNEN